MSRNFHDVSRGLSLDESVEIIAINGPPVGGDADVVGLGAVAIDFANGHLYQKNDVGTGSDKWQFIGADKSYREPALVRQNVSTTLPSATPSTNDTQDGVTITDGDRVLFSNLTVNPNVYIYEFSSGTYSEDTNEATDGDTLMIEDGTDAGRSYTFNGTAWVLTNQADNDELGFIRVFIGKTAAGSETPTYSSAVIVTQNTDLESAIGELDAHVAGLTVLTSTSLSSVSGTNTLDSVLVDDFAAVKWLVTCRQGASMVSREVWASHDGIVSGADATGADDTEYASIKSGSPISGLAIAVDVSGAGASQVMRLQVTSTGAADWFATRVPVAF
jgi:hypothetical protein